MKMAFTASVLAYISNADDIDEPTYEHLMELLEAGKCKVEFVMPWNGQPGLIISEVKDAA